MTALDAGPGGARQLVLDVTSEDAVFVTGQVFTVDGGLTAGSPLRPGLL